MSTGHASGNSLWLAPSVTDVDSDYEDKFGVGVEIQYRAYVFKKVTEKHIKNIFFAPYGFYKYFSLNEDNYYTCGYGIDDAPDLRENNINVFGGGMIFGMQYVFAEKVHLDFYAGGGLRKADKDNYYDYFLEPGYSGFAPKVGIDIGFSF
ncbi:MAG: hypothetical protein U5L09_18345 [Bacteroidales bacterium]|nr:hypothetical protein [Bacteroidales bacterium]